MKLINTLLIALLCALPAIQAAPPATSTLPDDSRYIKTPKLIAGCTQRVADIKGKPCDLIFIGDSITEGWAGRGRKVWDTHYAPLGALNFGISGDRTQNVIWRLDNMDISNLHPKVAVILIGTNNGSDTPADIAKGVRTVISRTQEKFEGIKIILVSIMPNKRANQKMMDTNSIIREYEKTEDESVTYLDLVPLMTPVGDNWLGLSKDHLHPDESGYELWAKALDPLIKKSLAAFHTLTAEERAEHNQRMAWFREAKFGMFIHWGLYSVPAGEWNGKKGYAEWFQLETKMPNAQYEKFAQVFNPVKFDGAKWADVAAKAGMKYMVITSRHHDGFSMFDSKATDYTIVKQTPYAKDPMKELSTAARAAGLTFCFYYSIADWHHPEIPAPYDQGGFHGNPNPNADVKKYDQFMRDQVSELLTNYGPIGIIWFDGGGSFRIKDRAKILEADKMAALIHAKQPATLINDRLGASADYGTPEQRIPGGKLHADFEVCMTLNKHWGYNKADNNWKETKEVVQKLADICSKGGNFLLNVGPTSEGELPPDAIRILGQVGQWMDKNGDSIYGTTASPLDYIPSWGVVTAKAEHLYLHVLKWPTDGKITVKTNQVLTQAYALSNHTALTVSQVGDEITISVPSAQIDPNDTVIVLK